MNRYILNFRPGTSYAFEFVMPAYDEYEYELYIMATSRNPEANNAYYYTEVQKIPFKTLTLEVKSPTFGLTASDLFTKIIPFLIFVFLYV